MRSVRATHRAQLALFACALFSGVALLSHIATGVSLPVALATLAAIVVASSLFVWRRTPPQRRVVLQRLVTTGARAGVVATIAYDSSKFVLSKLDPTPYNPFEMMRIFGALLTGSTSRAIVLPAGIAYHLLNGTAFGVAFCILFGSRGVVAGIAWGLGLEFFQVALYPGWLGINMYREFVQFSVLGHVVYGIVLGFMCRQSLVPRRVMVGQ
jgi:hypothetical protein